ncbi:MAG: Nif3-like dinuclear metal center hexameric protein [Oscillospiraceae bacterium]
MIRAYEIYNYLNEIAPFSAQLQWDNSGFLVGDMKSEVKKVLLTLDVTDEVVKEAIYGKFDLIVSHHPIIFKGQTAFLSSSLSYKCATNNISVISSHTSYDVADGGVNDVLAEAIGLKNIEKSPNGEFRIGDTEEMETALFALLVKNKLNTIVRFNNTKKMVKKIAVCGGAATEYMYEARDLGADVFLTGDGKHHEFLNADEIGFCLMSAGHFETEVIAVKSLLDRMKLKFDGVTFEMSKEKTPIITI